MVRSVSFGLLLTGAFWLALDSKLAAADKVDPPAREAARESVRQALVAETLGDNTLRARKLGQAFLAAPELDAANWHLARVRIGDKWLSLADAESQVAEDKTNAEYRKLRQNAETARALQVLARWCLKHGWDDAAQLHFAQLLARRDATPAMREEAIKHLDLVQVGGRWITRDEVEAREAEAKAIQESLAKWRPKLKALQLVIDGPDFAKRDKAIAELAQLDDPQMIPALESFLLDGKADFQEQAVQRLATFPHYESTEALVRYAVLSDSVIVRDAAIEILQGRSLHDYCPLLLHMLSATLKIECRFELQSDASVLFVQSLTRETSSTSSGFVSMHRMIPTQQNWLPQRGRRIVVNRAFWTDLDNAMRRDLQALPLRSASAKKTVEIANTELNDHSRRARDALHKATGQRFPDNDAWWTWWADFNEYHWPKAREYAYANTYQLYDSPPPYVRTSCFLAGTPVRTQAGLASIESLQPGDRVLAQDQDTGELTYKLVLRTTLRPPARMVRITAGSESITTTLGHPFWVSGHGWKMAKELVAGDRLHSHGGAIEVLAVDPLDKPQPAHNLVVADFNSYFVGNQGLLVHDNEFRQPTRAIVPGLEK